MLGWACLVSVDRQNSFGSVSDRDTCTNFKNRVSSKVCVYPIQLHILRHASNPSQAASLPFTVRGQIRLTVLDGAYRHEHLRSACQQIIVWPPVQILLDTTSKCMSL